MTAGQPSGGDSPPLTFENLIIKGRWRIVKLIGKGAFGQVYMAEDLVNSDQVAMKIESPLAKKPVLKLEITVLRKVQDSPFFTRFLGCGRFLPPVKDAGNEMIHSYMVMDLLGTSLADLRKKSPDGKLSLKLSAIVAKQMVRAIEALHQQGILHRDIKPANFCLERHADGSDTEHVKCFMIDFGLSRRFLSGNGKVREERQSVGFRGTARYASINAHFGKDLGRVDDLWSLLYVVIEFITGTLPWKGKNKEIIGQLKQDLTNPKLFEECPPHLLRIFHHLKSLRYGDLPDYDLIETAFDHILDDLTLEASGVPTSKSFEDMMSDRMSEDVDVAVAEEEDEDAVVLDDDDDEQTGNANNHLAPMLITSPARSLKKVGIKDFKEGATTLMESSTVPVTLKAVLGSPPKTILTRSQAAAMAAVHAVQSLVPRQYRPPLKPRDLPAPVSSTRAKRYNLRSFGRD